MTPSLSVIKHKYLRVKSSILILLYTSIKLFFAYEEDLNNGIVRLINQYIQINSMKAKSPISLLFLDWILLMYNEGIRKEIEYLELLYIEEKRLLNSKNKEILHHLQI